jgi:hypothetical protein
MPQPELKDYTCHSCTFCLPSQNMGRFCHNDYPPSQILYADSVCAAHSQFVIADDDYYQERLVEKLRKVLTDFTSA